MGRGYEGGTTTFPLCFVISGNGRKYKMAACMCMHVKTNIKHTYSTHARRRTMHVVSIYTGVLLKSY